MARSSAYVGRSTVAAFEKANEKVLPEWVCLQKVNYVVGTPPDDLTEVQLCVEANARFNAELMDDDVYKGEWLKDPASGYLLPIKSKKPDSTDSREIEGKSWFQFAMMAVPDEKPWHGVVPPEGMIICELPPEGYPPFPDANAPPGGSWVEESYFGPTSKLCIALPCCWICFLAMGRGNGIDMKIVYYGPDGNKYTDTGDLLGQGKLEAEAPPQQIMSRQEVREMEAVPSERPTAPAKLTFRTVDGEEKSFAFSRQEMRERQDDFTFGLSYIVDRSPIVITALPEDSYAKQLGVEVGMCLIEIDGKSVENDNFSSLDEKLVLACKRLEKRNSVYKVTDEETTMVHVKTL